MAKKKSAGSPAPVDTPTASAPAAVTRRRRAVAPQGAAEASTAPSTADDRVVAGAATLSTADAALTTSSPTYDQIAEAAYQRYLSRGGGHGMDFDDWIEAERSLKVR